MGRKEGRRRDLRNMNEGQSQTGTQSNRVNNNPNHPSHNFCCIPTVASLIRIAGDNTRCIIDDSRGHGWKARRLPLGSLDSIRRFVLQLKRAAVTVCRLRAPAVALTRCAQTSQQQKRFPETVLAHTHSSLISTQSTVVAPG